MQNANLQLQIHRFEARDNLQLRQHLVEGLNLVQARKEDEKHRVCHLRLFEVAIHAESQNFRAEHEHPAGDFRLVVVNQIVERLAHQEALEVIQVELIDWEASRHGRQVDDGWKEVVAVGSRQFEVILELLDLQRRRHEDDLRVAARLSHQASDDKEQKVDGEVALVD